LLNGYVVNKCAVNITDIDDKIIDRVNNEENSFKRNNFKI
jgi:cysteinyl-tRNA synthetase